MPAVFGVCRRGLAHSLSACQGVSVLHQELVALAKGLGGDLVKSRSVGECKSQGCVCQLI